MIKGTITGDREVVARFNRMPGGLQQNLVKTITRLCIKLQVHVKQDKLSGQVLNVRSGRLRRSITYHVATLGASTAQGTVGTNLPYAPPFEKGFQGTEEVREHLRMMTKAWGKPVKDPHKITVRAHTRKVNIAPKSFLGSALKDMTPEILEQIDLAVKESIK